MGLEQWGASEQYDKIASGYPEYELGRVISQEKDLFRVVMDKEECTARVSGKFRYNVSAISEFPSVGDFVLIEHSFKDDVAVIHKVLPRKSVFIRKAAGKNCMEQVVAANIDTVFLCMALNRDFNIRRNIPIMTMGPICIKNEYKRKGYGKILLNYSLEKAAEFGCGALCFEGNIDFYGKSGFRQASEYGIRYHGLPEGEDASFFLCKELVPGYLDGITGEYLCYLLKAVL